MIMNSQNTTCAMGFFIADAIFQEDRFTPSQAMSELEANQDILLATFGPLTYAQMIGSVSRRLTLSVAQSIGNPSMGDALAP